MGHLLREWRAARGLSQLDLAMRAGFSSRHVSFIETGRTQPSRQALLAIAETLDVPLRERNRLLEAGGFAHVYRQTPLAAEEMRHVRGVLQFILDRHEPYGAVVLDRYSNLLMANAAATRMLGGLVDSSFLTGTPNLLRIVFHPAVSGVHRQLGRGRRHLLAGRNESSTSSATSQRRGACCRAARLRRRRAAPSGGAYRAGRCPASRPHQAGRPRRALVQHHHDARDATGRDAAGAEGRDVLSGRRGDGSPPPQSGPYLTSKSLLPAAAPFSVTATADSPAGQPSGLDDVEHGPRLAGWRDVLVRLLHDLAVLEVHLAASDACEALPSVSTER